MPVIWRNLTLDFPVFCFSPLQVSFQNQVLVSSEPQQPFHRLQAWQKRQPSTLKELLDTAEAWKEWVEKAEIKPGLTVTACNDIYCRLSSLTDVPMYHLCLSCVGDVIFSGWQWQRGLIQLEKKKKKKICYVFFPTPTHTNLVEPEVDIWRHVGLTLMMYWLEFLSSGETKSRIRTDLLCWLRICASVSSRLNWDSTHREEEPNASPRTGQRKSFCFRFFSRGLASSISRTAVRWRRDEEVEFTFIHLTPLMYKIT